MNTFFLASIAALMALDIEDATFNEHVTLAPSQKTPKLEHSKFVIAPSICFLSHCIMYAIPAATPDAAHIAPQLDDNLFCFDLTYNVTK